MNLMEPSESINENKKTSKFVTFMETRQDFQESWRLLKQNFRAFNGTILFAIGSSFLTIFILMGLITWFSPSTEIFTNHRFFLDSDFRWIVLFIGILILTVFINCQTGLAHDIMSSGNMFAEFRSSFAYFRQHWWKYILLSFIIGTPTSSIPQWLISERYDIFPPELSGLIKNLFGIIIVLTFFILLFLWNSVFSQSLASVNVQGSFLGAIIESIRIFKANPKRVICTWGLYTLIFYSPIWIFELTLRFIELSDFVTIVITFSFMTVYAFIFIFIGLPMRALIITGLYNNIQFTPISLKNKTETNPTE